MSQPVKRAADVAFQSQELPSETTRKKPRHKKHRSDKVKDSSPVLISNILPNDVTATDERPLDGHTISAVEQLLRSPALELAAAKAERKRKKHEKKSKTRSDTPNGTQIAVDSQKTVSLHRESKKQKQREGKHQRTTNNRIRPSAQDETLWTFTGGIGGMFIEHDPVLSLDEKYLIIPTSHDVQIYSTATSLLVRSLSSKDLKNITSCALSESDPSKLLVGTSDGTLSIWNWSQGRRSNKWQLDIGIAQVLSVESKARQEKILVLHKGADMLGTIVAYELDPSSLKPIKSQVLLRRRPIFAPIMFFETRGLIVAHSAEAIIIGYSPGCVASSLCDASFTWRDVAISSNIASFDVKVGAGDEMTSKRTPSVDIVLGLRSGQILLYEDVLFKLMGQEKGKTTEDVSARNLHWHRNAVNTVKWSKDGNYVISGGSETVLVIWQLDTNQQQFLPHLSTSILNLTVTPSGSSYAMRLGDNSVMILATADLLPSTNVTGLAIGHTPEANVPAVLHPLSPEQLLVAVPGNAIELQNPQGKRATALQIYDLARSLQTGRQALTRNIITTVNHGPEGDLLDEPNILHMQISHDGKWLATFESWSPSQSSLDRLYLNQEDDRQKQTQTCLRFWGYNEQSQNWELVTRIDDPHAHHIVLDMKAHPTRAGFATLGADCTLRTWSPKARLRDGVRIKDQLGNQLYTWACMSTFPGRATDKSEQSDECITATHAFSDDGSICAVSYSGPPGTTRYVDLLDIEAITVHSSIPGLVTSGEAIIAFQGRYLLCLSQTFCVFDVVSMQSVFSIDLFSAFRASSRKQFLATNKLDGTFAIGVEQDNLPKARFAVFDVQHLDEGPVFQSLVDGHITALLSSQSVSGYVVIDNQSRVRHVRPPGIRKGDSQSTDANVKEDFRSLSGIFGSASDTREAARTTEMSSTTNGVLSGPTRLEDVLSFQTSAEAPPIGELFNKIASIFASSAA